MYIILITFSAPVQAVLGDISKWVPMSSDRVRDLTYGRTDIVATLDGPAEETVSMYFLVNNEVKQSDCSLKSPDCILYAGEAEN